MEDNGTTEHGQMETADGTQEYQHWQGRSPAEIEMIERLMAPPPSGRCTSCGD